MFLYVIVVNLVPGFTRGSHKNLHEMYACSSDRLVLDR